MSSEGLLRRGPSGRVGIVLLTGIGDVVHGLPIANDLKRDDPSREVVWVAEPAPAEVVRNHPSVDRVVVFRKGAGLKGILQLRRDLAGPRMDVTVNFMRYAKGLPPALLLGGRRLGLPRTMTRDGVHLLHPTRLPDQPWCHTQDLFLQMRGPLGLPTDGPVEWGIHFTDAERSEQAAFFERLRSEADGRPIVGVVLATANAAKDLPGETSAALCAALEAHGMQPLLVGGPSRRERSVADTILSRGGRTRDGLGDSVRSMMWMVDGVDLLVSPDTGPLHLAHAMGTPVVGLFGHTNPWRVGPWRNDHDLIVDRYNDPGAPRDPSLYDPRHGRMEMIEVEDILEKVHRGLGRTGGESSS